MPTTRRALGAALLAMPALAAEPGGPIQPSAPGGAPAIGPPWPTHPLRIIVPWAPGGGVDIIARGLAAPLAEALGQPCLVENRTGGGGIIGMGEAARAAPDGHTLLALDNSYTMLPHTMRSLPWDHANAFAPLVLGASGPFMILLRAGLDHPNLAAFIAAARAAPEKFSFGSGGAGSSPHFATEDFQAQSGIRLLHIPFRGGAEAMLAVAAGQVDLVLATVSAAQGQLAAGRLRALALCAPARSALVPDVPTATEAGLPGFTGGIWAGLAVPRGTPEAVQARLAAEAQAALRNPALRQRFAAQGLEPSGLGRAEFAALVREETTRWGRVAAAARIEKS